MTTTKLPARKKRQAPASPDHLYLQGVSWKFYEQVLAELEKSHLRIAYDHNDLEIMATTMIHEINKKNISRILDTYSLFRNIPTEGLGSSYLVRKDLAKGIEADDCYYVANRSSIGRIRTLDLAVVPPPDVVVEVDINRYILDHESIYSAIGVPELWRFDGRRITYTVRNRRGKYIVSDRSPSFPEFSTRDFNRFIGMAQKGSQHEAVQTLRDWVGRSQ
jgi:Uma2 family endonuclease